MLVSADALPQESLPYPDARFDYDLPEEVVWMKQRERAHLLDIRFDSRLTSDRGRVSARTIGTTISELQNLLDAIGQELGQSAPNMMGKIPDRILRQTRMNPVGAYSGSFGIRLESHQQDGVTGATLIGSSLGRFYSLLEAVADPEVRLTKADLEIREFRSSEPTYGVHHFEESYGPPVPRPGVEEVHDHFEAELDREERYAVQLPGRRVRRHLGSLLDSLATFPGEVTLSWVRPSPDKVRKVTLELYGSSVQMLLRRAELDR